jgi:hypothetical protein
MKINQPLNNQWITEETKKENLKCLETNENRDTTYQNLWEARCGGSQL